MTYAEDRARALAHSADAAERAQAARTFELASLGESAARAAAARGMRLADTLSPLPSTATAFDVDGAHAIHFLRARKGLFSGLDYCARIDLPGVLPAFLITGGFGEVTDDAVIHVGRGFDDDKSFGPRQRFHHEVFDRWLKVRTRAPDVLLAFTNDTVAAGFPRSPTRIALVQHTAALSVLEVDVFVGDGRHCEAAATTALQLGHIALALVRNHAIFAERAVDTRPPAEQLESLLSLLSSSTSWLSGPVARVGDGVEARLELDEQAELPCALRLDVDGVTGLVTLFLRAPLKTAPTKTTTLSPQASVLDQLRGLIDVHVGVTAFDNAWLCKGDVDDVKVLQRAETELAALHQIGATITWGAEGLVVRAPGFAFDGDDVADAVDACLRLWRSLVRRGHGLDDGVPR